MNEINGHDIVIRIDNCLKAMGLNREKLANHIGKNKQVFTDWKNCNIIPKADDLYKIAKFLGVPMEYLLIGENVMNDEVAAVAAMITAIDKKNRQPVIAMLQSQVEYWRNNKKK